MTKKINPYKLLKFLAWCLAGLALLCGLLVAVLQTHWIKNRLAGMAAAALTTPDRTVDIEGLKGFLPFEINVQSITVSDDQGVALRIERAGLAWDPLGLVRGRIVVTSIQAHSILVDHLPQSKPGVQPETKPAPLELPQLPSLVVESLDLESITLGPAVAGARGTFSLQAELDLRSRQTLQGSLNLVQTDQPGFKLKAQAALQEQKLSLDLTVQENPSGFLDTLWSNRLSLPMTLKLAGQGRLEDWQGRLELSSGPDTLAQSTVNISVSKRTTGLQLEGMAMPHDLLPPKLQQVVRPRDSIPVALTVVHEKTAGLIKVRNFQLQSSLADLDLHGQADLKAQELSLQAGLNCPEIAALEPLLPIRAAGRAELQLKAQGTWTHPDLALDLTATKLLVADIGIPEAELALSASLPASPLERTITVKGSGRFSSIRKGGAQLIQEPADVRLLTSYHPSGRVEVAELKLTSPAEVIQLAATLQPDRTFSSQLTLTLEQLERHPIFKPSGLSGRLELGANLQGGLDPLSLSADLSARTENLNGLPIHAEPLAGSHQELRASLLLDQGSKLTIDSMTLQTPHADVNLNGLVNLASQELDLSFRLDGPDLGTMKLFPPQELGGHVTAAGSILGPWSAVTAEARLNIENLAHAGLKPANMSASFAARDLASSPAGSLQLSLQRQSSSLDASLDFALSGQTLTLANLELEGPQTRLSGQAAWPLASAEGRQASLDLQADSLSWLETFIPFACSGKADLKAELGQHDGAIQLSARGSVQDIQLPWFTIGQSELEAAISDLGRLAGTVSLTGSGIVRQDISLSTVDIQGEGDLSGASFSISAQGGLPRPFALKTKGFLASREDRKSLTLQTGSGFFATLDFGWDQPIRFTRDPQELRLLNSAIDLGQGTVQLQAWLRGGSALQVGVQAHGLELNELPLQQLRTVSGRLQSDISVSGTLQDPRIQLEAQLSKVKSSIETARDMPPLAATLVAAYDGDVLQASLKSDQVDLNRLQAHLQLPAELALHPFQLAARDVSGHLAGHLDLNRMNRLIPLDGQQYGGELDLDLRVTGPYQTPVLDGGFELKQGSYQNALSGFALTDIEVAGTVRDRTLRIKTIKASDGAQGSLSGQGQLELKPGKGLAFELSTSLDSARLIRLDMAQGSVNGTLKVAGSTEQASIAGSLSIFPLEISLPQPGPPGTSGLIIRDRHDIQEGKAEPEPSNQSSEDSFLSRTDLDIKVTLPRGTFVRGRGLDSEWQAELEVQGKASAPKINGQVRTVRGHLNLLTKRFSLTKGTITFADEFPPQPLLDITATHQAKEITVIVRVTGPAGDPSIRLESEPAYPRDEIVARLLFNRELSTITPVQAVKLALAVRTLTSGGGGGIMDKTRSLLGLDELEVSAGGQEEGATVGVGKYLREDIYFKVEKGLDSETGQVTVDIEISPRFSLETRAGALNQGMTFKWSYQY